MANYVQIVTYRKLPSGKKHYTENVIAVTPHLEGQALANTKHSVSGVVIRGTKWSDLPAKKLLWKSLDNKTINNFKINIFW